LKPEQRSAIQTGIDSGAYRIALPLQILAYGDHDQAPMMAIATQFSRHLLDGKRWNFCASAALN